MSFAANISRGIADAAAVREWAVVKSYTSYADAQQAVDRLSDASFPVDRTEIIGRDLRLVEQAPAEAVEV